MKGIFAISKGQTGVLDIPEPELKPYEALVKVLACGICNSTDWKLIKGEFCSGTFPILLGHESVGRVIKLGEGVRSYRLGDMVLRSRLGDEHIPLPGGRSRWGGFVEKAIVTDVWAKQDKQYNAFPHPQQIVPEQITPAEAAAMITLKETLSCLKNSDVQPGHSLAVVGTGPVGQSLLLFAKLSGISPVVVFGRRSILARRFAELGADGYVANDDIPPEVRTILDRGGFDRVIEAVGSRAALSRCLQIVKQDGRVSIYGVAPESEPYLPDELSDPRVSQVRVAEAETHDEMLRWVEDGKVRLSDWLSHEMPWTEYQQGLDMIRDKTANKVILTYS